MFRPIPSRLRARTRCEPRTARGPILLGLLRTRMSALQFTGFGRHRSSETDFADAIAEVFGAAQDFDFNAHEVNRQIAAVNLRKPYGILLRRDNHLGLPLLAAVDGIDNFLLAETMVIGKALRVHQFAAEVHQAALEA